MIAKPPLSEPDPYLSDGKLPEWMIFDSARKAPRRVECMHTRVPRLKGVLISSEDETDDDAVNVVVIANLPFSLVLVDILWIDKPDPTPELLTELSVSLSTALHEHYPDRIA